MFNKDRMDTLEIGICYGTCILFKNLRMNDILVKNVHVTNFHFHSQI